MFTATKPLPLTVPTIVGESATSFASRLARRNGVPRMIAFCSDVGIDYFALVNGDPVEIQRLAVLGDIDPVPLQAATPSLIEPGWFRLGNERIKFTAFARTTLRICPMCAQNPDDRTGIVHHGIWQLAAIRSCERHGCHLVAVPRPANANDCFDHIPMVDHFQPAGIVMVKPNHLELENYLINRIQNGPGGTWLDQSPLHVAAQACEMLGLLLTIGPKAKRSETRDPQWAVAGSAGLQVLQEGPNSLRKKLRAIRDAHPIEEKLHRYHYGVFFEWLRYRDDDKDFDIFRNIVRDFIFKNFPIATGAIVFGKPCPEQQLHSFQTAEKAFGIPHIRLGRKLAEMGIARPESGGRFYKLNKYIPTAVLNGVCSELAALVGTKEAAKSIGINYTLFERLADQGLIKRYYESDQGSSYYSKRDVEDFIDSLRQLLRHPGSEIETVDISTAARLRGIMTAHVTDHILTHRITLYAASTHPVSFREFRLQLNDLGRLKGRRREKIVSSAEVARALKVSRPTVYRLREEGHLQVATERKGEWVRRGHYSTRASFEKFRSEIISLEELAETSGRSLVAERSHQIGHGALPISLGGKCSDIFRRNDVV
ncbi:MULTISPECIES: TniQ family protein [Paracoccus]|uniref:TniQ protein n=1 Tax=Paracoccus versutus TaxID=34007 RepID=A0A3D9XNL0_PARVE|nr:MULTISPECIES: TniQ family protein [Paracoccus]REF69752.1 TniQ protein [Paracoccus versutus]WGR57886.1 hypothetical protein E3U25_18230 [Paracoccus versutus]